MHEIGYIHNKTEGGNQDVTGIKHHSFFIRCTTVDGPHAHQPKKSKYPKTRKLTSSDENVQFFCFGDASKY